MRKLLGGGRVGITLGFADNKVERVVLQNSLYGDSVAHSVTSASPPKSFKHEDRTRKELRRPGNLVRASHGACSSHSEHFATLGLSAAASRQEIKQAYRKLALQYHPDVCKGEHCALMFKQVNDAYYVALEAEEQVVNDIGTDDCLDGFMGAEDDSWDEWEEWMGWEGAGTRNYSNHVNYAT